MDRWRSYVTLAIIWLTSCAQMFHWLLFGRQAVLLGYTGCCLVGRLCSYVTLAIIWLTKTFMCCKCCCGQRLANVFGCAHSPGGAARTDTITCVAFRGLTLPKPLRNYAFMSDASETLYFVLRRVNRPSELTPADIP